MLETKHEQDDTEPFLFSTCPEELVTLSEDGAVATQSVHEEDTLTTSRVALTEGKHYWEAKLLSDEMSDIYIGVTRPGLDPRVDHSSKENANSWFISAHYGALCGNGKGQTGRKGPFEFGDHVGVLLDLDEGSLCFFKNGVQHGRGYPARSVAGPVVLALQMWHEGQSVRIITPHHTCWPSRACSAQPQAQRILR
jgi:hypothetical protein